MLSRFPDAIESRRERERARERKRERERERKRKGRGKGELGSLTNMQMEGGGLCVLCKAYLKSNG